MDPAVLALLTQFGPIGIAIAVGLAVFGPRLKNRLMPSKPNVPPVPTVPTDPTAPPRFPILDAILKSMFGPKAPLVEKAHPDLVAKIKAEVDDWLNVPPEAAEVVSYGNGPCFPPVSPIVDRDRVFLDLVKSAARRRYPDLDSNEAVERMVAAELSSAYWSEEVRKEKAAESKS